MSQKKFMPLGVKVALVAATFSLPILVLLFFVITNINSEIRFSTLELAGNAYQRPLEKLLDDVQQYQLLTENPTQSATAATRVDELATAIESSFIALAKIDQQLGDDLQFTDEGLKKRGREQLRANLLKEQWQAIAARQQREGSESDHSTAAGKLAASLREAITHAGDTSNLILDPDLDSYYLMDATLLALPQTQDRLANVIAFGRDRLQSGEISEEDRVQLAVFAAMLEESDLARVTESLKTSLNEDSNFYGVSPTLASVINRASETYRRTNTEFVDLVRQVAGSNQPSVSPEDFVAAGLTARNASFALWNDCVEELDLLLATRVQSHVARRTLALTGSGVAVAIACVLAMLLTRSITKPLQTLAESLSPGADLLNNSVEMLSESPENADIICEELAAHVGYMRRAVQQLVVVVRGGEVISTPPVKTPRKKRELELVGV